MQKKPERQTRMTDRQADRAKGGFVDRKADLDRLATPGGQFSISSPINGAYPHM